MKFLFKKICFLMIMIIALIGCSNPVKTDVELIVKTLNSINHMELNDALKKFINSNNNYYELTDAIEQIDGYFDGHIEKIKRLKLSSTEGLQFQSNMSRVLLENREIWKQIAKMIEERFNTSTKNSIEKEELTKKEVDLLDRKQANSDQLAEIYDQLDLLIKQNKVEEKLKSRVGGK